MKNNNKMIIRLTPLTLFLLLVLYLASTVPVGLALYAAKEKLGWNVFKTGGFHHFLGCLGTEAQADISPAGR
jgi:hypothetical protein